MKKSTNLEEKISRRLKGTSVKRRTKDDKKSRRRVRAHNLISSKLASKRKRDWWPQLVRRFLFFNL